MAQNLKLITSRRAYEFRMDDLRLSVLCLPDVYTRIQQMFGFEGAVVATPQETFGPVLGTLPPGLVFNIGVVEADIGPATPIRFLHFEHRRIVVDVAGPSSAIDVIFAALEQELEGLTAPDGSPVMGEVDRVLDYSEYSGQFTFSLGSILNPDLQDLFLDVAGGEGRREHETVVLPTVTLGVHRGDEEYGGLAAESGSRRVQIAVRAGTRPEDGIGFSGAPLDSKAHRSYLTELERILVGQEVQTEG